MIATKGEANATQQTRSLHLVWATWDRLPLITPDIERRLYRNIESETQKLGCTVLALNGTEDHIHLLIMISSTLTVADLGKQVKGVSSHFVNEVLKPSAQFKWQGSYGAFTVSRWDVEKIKEYIKHQKEHHQSGELDQSLKKPSRKSRLMGRCTLPRPRRRTGGHRPSGAISIAYLIITFQYTQMDRPCLHVPF